MWSAYSEDAAEENEDSGSSAATIRGQARTFVVSQIQKLNRIPQAELLVIDMNLPRFLMVPSGFNTKFETLALGC